MYFNPASASALDRVGRSSISIVLASLLGFSCELQRDWLISKGCCLLSHRTALKGHCDRGIHNGSHFWNYGAHLGYAAGPSVLAFRCFQRPYLLLSWRH